MLSSNIKPISLVYFWKFIMLVPVKLERWLGTAGLEGFLQWKHKLLKISKACSNQFDYSKRTCTHNNYSHACSYAVNAITSVWGINRPKLDNLNADLIPVHYDSIQQYGPSRCYMYGRLSLLPYMETSINAKLFNLSHRKNGPHYKWPCIYGSNT